MVPPRLTAFEVFAGRTMRDMAKHTSMLRPARLIGLSLAASLALASCAETSDNPYASAIEAVEGHDYSAARVFLQQAIEQDPDNQQARLLYARTLLMLGNPEGAVAQVEAMSGSSRSSAEAVALLAKGHLLAGNAQAALDVFEAEGMDSGEAFAVASGAHLALGDPEQADAMLEAGQAKFPDSVDVIVLAAQRAFDFRDRAAARQGVERALSMQPDHLDALRLAGRMELRERNLDASAEKFKQVLAIAPWDLPAHLALAAIARDKGDNKEAQEWIAAAQKVAPGNPVSAYFAAEIAFEAGDVRSAQSFLNEIDANGADFPALWLLRGRVSAEQGNPKTAMTEFERYFDTGGDAHDARFDLARLYLTDGKQGDAWTVLQPALRSANATVPTLQLGRDLARRLGRTDESALASRLTLATERAGYDAQLREADVAMRAGNWTKANSVYSALLAKGDLADPVVLNNAANVRLQLGDAAGGRDLARRAYALAPNDPIILDTLGWAIMQADGKTPEAVSLVRRAYEAAPNNPEIAEHWMVMSQN